MSWLLGLDLNRPIIQPELMKTFLQGSLKIFTCWLKDRVTLKGEVAVVKPAPPAGQPEQHI